MIMENTTNLEEIKEIAHEFLYLDVQETEFSPVIVSHPFFSTGIVPTYGGKILNIMESEKELQEAQKQIDKRIAKTTDVLSILYLFNKPYRIVFVHYAWPYLSEKDKADCLREAWITSDNPNEDKNISLETLTEMFKECKKEYLMDEDNLKVYSNLPENITAYRGIYEGGNENGLSWTLNYEIAERFSHRFNTVGIILEKNFQKQQILAYFGDRDEEEIIVEI